MIKLRALNIWVLAFLGIVIAGKVFAPHDPYDQAFLGVDGNTFSWTHPFGIDHLGQDVFSRVWVGGANSLWFAFMASLSTMAIAGFLLVIERVGGRWVSQCIRSVVSLGIALPVLLLGLLFMIFLPREPMTLVWAIAIAGAPFAFRQLRVMWLEQQAAGYVVASRAIGGDRWHVVRFSILPNLKPQFVELWKVVYAIGILELSSLTFLGLGGDQNWAELGSLLRGYQKHLIVQPMLVVWPGLALCGVLLTIRQLRSE